MFGKFLPLETSFFDFFERHIKITIQAIEELQALASSTAVFDFRDLERFKRWEHEADIVVHECVEALHKTFITPIDRENILRLISDLDDIIDCIDASFECLVVYRIEKSTPDFQKLSQLLLQAVLKVSFIVKGLRHMKNAPEIREACHFIRRLENEADGVLRNAIGKLFDEEQDTRLVIKLKELYEILEDAIDHCHTVANLMEGIILEYD